MNLIGVPPIGMPIIDTPPMDVSLISMLPIDVSLIGVPPISVSLIGASHRCTFIGMPLIGIPLIGVPLIDIMKGRVEREAVDTTTTTISPGVDGGLCRTR